ncbi:MAG: hypothetical protein QUS08_05850, partial [Methanothrix sp.]|nr:hypothetical protein [Methanothrix sp.]
YNAPSSPTFEPDVEKYWGTYITGAGNLTKSSLMSDMEIWMNTFPLKFSTPLKLTGSSFTANVQAPSLTQTELTSQFLTREVTGQFGIYEVKAYKPVIGSLSSQNATGVPGENAKGQILSQSIISLFSV